MKVELNAKVLEALKQLVDYNFEAERKSYEEYVANCGKPKDHIFSSIKKISKWLRNI